MNKIKHDGASAIGIIGNPDEETLQIIRDMTGKPVRKVERKGKIKIIIGKGLRRKIIHMNLQKMTPL